MGTTLTGTTPQDTYDSLIKVTDNGPLSGSLKVLSDGLGNDSTLSLSTTAASIAGTLAVTGNATFDTTTLFVDAANNKVGIGTATPNQPLTVGATNGYPVIDFENSNTAYGDVGFQVDKMVLSAYSSTPLTFWTNSNERVRITSAGNVGIGTTAPNIGGYVAGNTVLTMAPSGADKFSVLQLSGNRGFGGNQNGNIDFINSEGTATITSRISAINGANALDGQIAFETRTSAGSLTERFRITNNGVTFNGDSAAANALDDYEEGTFTPSVAGGTTAGTATYTQRVGVYTKIGRQVSVQIDLGWNSGTGTGLLTITGLPFADTSNTNPAITIGFFDGITLTASNYALAYIPSLSSTIDIVQTPVGGGTLTSVAYDAAGRIILNVTYTA